MVSYCFKAPECPGPGPKDEAAVGPGVNDSLMCLGAACAGRTGTCMPPLDLACRLVCLLLVWDRGREWVRYGSCARGYPCVCTVPRPSLTCCACECECGLGPYQSPSIRILCTVCVCDGTPTQPTSPHLPARKLCGRVLRLCCPNPRHATSAAVALVRPAPLLAITYLLTRQTLPRQLNLLTAVIVDRKSHCVPHPPLCRSRECLHPVNKMCTYSNTTLSGAVIRARRLWISCGTGWETRMSLRLRERSGYRSS